MSIQVQKPAPTDQCLSADVSGLLGDHLPVAVAPYVDGQEGGGGTVGLDAYVVAGHELGDGGKVTLEVGRGPLAFDG